MNNETDDSRWKKRLGTSIAVAIGFFLLFPATICGCHFHPEAFVIGLVPIGWGLFALVTYRDRNGARGR